MNRSQWTKPLAPVKVGILLLVCGLIVSCSKAPAPPPAPPPVADTSKKKLSEMTMKELIRAGVSPGTAAYAKRLMAEQDEEIRQLETKVFAQVDQDWNKVLNLVSKTDGKGFDLTSIPVDPEASTEAQFYKQIYDARMSEFSRYRELTQDPPGARDAAWLFLSEYVANATQQKRTKPDASMEELHTAAMQAGSKDPLVRLYGTIPLAQKEIMIVTDETKRPYVALQEIAPQLIQGKYPPFAIFHAKFYAWKMSLKVDGKNTNPLYKEVCSSLVDWWADDSKHPELLGVTYTRTKYFLDQMKVPQLREMYLTVLGKDGIHAWLSHMFGANFHIKAGWESRGGNVASEVSDAGWKDLNEQGKLAQRLLMHAWYLEPKIIDAPVEMMSAALTDPEFGTARDWFVRAIKIRSDAFPAYNALDWSLRPRWGGTVKQLETFALACLKCDRFDTNIPKYGIDQLIKIQDQELGSGSLFDDNRVLPALVAFLEALNKATAAAPADAVISANQPATRQALAALFIKAGDRDHARSTLEPIIHQLSPSGYSSLGLDGSSSIGRMLVTVPELEEPLRRIDRAIETGVGRNDTPESFDPILQDIALIRKTFSVAENTEPLTEAKWNEAAHNRDTAKAAWIQRYVLQVETAIKRMKQFATQEWVDLTVDELLSGWTVDGYSWKVTPPDSIQITGDNSYFRYRLISLARFEPPYDVQVAADEALIKPQRTVPNVGLALGSTSVSTFENPGLRQFGIYPSSRLAAVWKLFETAVPPHMPAPITGPVGLPDPALIRVKVWDGGRYRFYVNNFLIEDRTDPEFQPGRDVTFGCGAQVTLAGAVKLSKMRIRKLTNPPPPENSDDDKAVETSARQAIAVDPDDATAHFELGRSLTTQQKFGEALSELQKTEKLAPMFETKGLQLLLAICYSRVGEYKLALEKFQTQASKPTDKLSASLLSQMTREQAYLRATAPVDEVRNGQLAVKLIEPLNQETKFANWDYLWVLAAAHAELGQFEEAKKRIGEAKVLAPEDQKELLNKAEKLFEMNQPYRDQAASRKDASQKNE